MYLNFLSLFIHKTTRSGRGGRGKGNREKGSSPALWLPSPSSPQANIRLVGDKSTTISVHPEGRPAGVGHNGARQGKAEAGRDKVGGGKKKRAVISMEEHDRER